jgi:type VI secretion system FHA domain protein
VRDEGLSIGLRMNLVLEIMGQSTPGLAGARKVFGVGGGSIGRAPECDWVLASPYVSRHHATVFCIDGVFYIESASENGVAVNTPQSVLPRLERRALKAGDRLFIDEYEISVGLSGAQGSDAEYSSRSPLLDPFSTSDEPPRAAIDELDQIGESNLDPLKGLSGSSPNTAPRRDSAWNHSSSLADHFTPPPVAPLAPSVLPIAEDWNQTEFNRPARSPERAKAPAIKDEPSKAAPVPTEWGNLAANKVASVPTEWDNPAANKAPVEPLVPFVPEHTAPRTSWHSGPPVTPAVTPRVSEPVPMFSAPESRPANANAMPSPSLQAGAAMDPIMRNMVQGLIEVLRARAEFRNQFRLPVTRVRTGENNPLKFAINADDAMDSLTSRRNAGFMPAAEAFEDAFNDIRFHQLAMLAGMRAGFECVMNRFDPQKLQERFDRQLKHSGFLAVTSKLRYWDLYADWFEELSGDADGAFQRLFGEEFASAYEQQLETLKRGRR